MGQPHISRLLDNLTMCCTWLQLCDSQNTSVERPWELCVTINVSRCQTFLELIACYLYQLHRKTRVT